MQFLQSDEAKKISIQQIQTQSRDKMLNLVQKHTWLLHHPLCSHRQLLPVRISISFITLITSHLDYVTTCKQKKGRQEPSKVKMSSFLGVNSYWLSVNCFNQIIMPLVTYAHMHTHTCSRLSSWQIFVTNNGLVVRGPGEEVKTDTRTIPPSLFLLATLICHVGGSTAITWHLIYFNYFDSRSPSLAFLARGIADGWHSFVNLTAAACQL